MKTLLALLLLAGCLPIHAGTNYFSTNHTVFAGGYMFFSSEKTNNFIVYSNDIYFTEPSIVVLASNMSADKLNTKYGWSATNTMITTTIRPSVAMSNGIYRITFEP